VYSSGIENGKYTDWCHSFLKPFMPLSYWLVSLPINPLSKHQCTFLPAFNLFVTSFAYLAASNSRILNNQWALCLNTSTSLYVLLALAPSLHHPFQHLCIDPLMSSIAHYLCIFAFLHRCSCDCATCHRCHMTYPDHF
jgi:hypothetical protein